MPSSNQRGDALQRRLLVQIVSFKNQAVRRPETGSFLQPLGPSVLAHFIEVQPFVFQ
jgi:hypothetical protein